MYTLRLPLYVSCFFALLFIYAAVSKIFDFENFQVQLAQSPLLSAFAGLISYGVLALELLTSAALLWNKTRRAALYAAFGLMVAFTVYIYLILNYSDYIPCSCGGILEKMSWGQHLVFNIVCVGLAWAGIVFIEKERARGWSRTAAFTALTAVFSGGSIGALFLSSEHIISRENNFTRRFSHHPIIEEKSADLKVNSYYFAGSSGDSIYLGNVSTPFRLIRMGYSLEKADTIDLVPQTNHRFRNLLYTVQDSMLYAHDGSVPVIYSAHIESLAKPLHEISSKELYFDQMVAVSPRSFILRVEDGKSKKTSLAALTLGPPTEVRINRTALTAKADGGFDADGQLMYDPAEGKGYYMFYYRNQILGFDDRLRKIIQMKTIDTVAEAKLKVVSLANGTKKLAAPPLLVNRNMLVHRGLIFNESRLLGKRESKELWKKNAVVDIYTTAPEGYLGSMYVQHRGKHKMSRMLVTDRYFFILSGDEIVRYRFAQAVTKYFISGGSRKPVSE